MLLFNASGPLPLSDVPTAAASNLGPHWHRSLSDTTTFYMIFCINGYQCPNTPAATQTKILNLNIHVFDISSLDAHSLTPIDVSRTVLYLCRQYWAIDALKGTQAWTWFVIDRGCFGSRTGRFSLPGPGYVIFLLFKCICDFIVFFREN